MTVRKLFQLVETGRKLLQTRAARKLVSLFIVCGMLPFALKAQPTDKPNVVLILADDLGYTDISPFGSEISTPNIAKLAAEGISFTNYHLSLIHISEPTRPY